MTKNSLIDTIAALSIENGNLTALVKTLAKENLKLKLENNTLQNDIDTACDLMEILKRRIKHGRKS